MKTENKIIKFLIETKKEPTIRELAKEIKSDYKIVHTAVSRLTEKGLLEKKKIGGSIQVKFTYRLSKEVFEVEFERREELLKNKNIKIMFDTIKKNIGNINFILILFGSYSKNKINEKSDIDLMFIVPEARIEEKIEQAISTLPLKIHSFVFTAKQFKDMKNSKEANVVHDAVKNNILLYGIEQYYELVKQEKI